MRLPIMIVALLCLRCFWQSLILMAPGSKLAFYIFPVFLNRTQSGGECLLTSTSTNSANTLEIAEPI